MSERQATSGPGGRILTNIGVWSPDGEWIAYDTRSDPAGERFDGARIEAVHVRTGEVRLLYEARNGAFCGVATFHPREHKVVFILGPERPAPDWEYCAFHRRGAVVDALRPGAVANLDARDLAPPFTPGALRGGSHVHVFSPDGLWASFTYEDHVLSRYRDAEPDHDINQRNVAVCIPGAVRAGAGHPRNHDGEYFSVLVTRTTARPRPGSDEIARACEEGWVGTYGYVRADGTRQRRALAFQGTVVTEAGAAIAEVFIADVPDDVRVPGAGPLEGTETRMPAPPRGTAQRRITFTADRPYPGLQGPRHWLRSAPDGSQIAFLMKDERGIVQLWTAAPNGGPLRQVTRNAWGIASAFSFSPDGTRVAHVMDGSVCVTDVARGATARLTERTAGGAAPRPEACVFSPDGTRIAYVRRVPSGGGEWNQAFIVSL